MNRHTTALAGLVAAALASTSLAINIELTYEHDAPPPEDPTGAKLMAVAHAAADMWKTTSTTPKRSTSMSPGRCLKVTSRTT